MSFLSAAQELTKLHHLTNTLEKLPCLGMASQPQCCGMIRQIQEVHGTVTALSSSVGDQRRAVQHLQSTVPSLVHRAEVSLVMRFLASRMR